MAGARGPARRKLVDRVLRRQNRRRRKLLTLRPDLVWRIVGAGGALAILLVAWPIVRDTLRRHPYFAVREVVVRHHGRLTATAVRSVAGIEPGTSIWDADLDEVNERLLREPWIRSARVRRELPDRVVITAREHRPTAIVAVDPGADLYYVAANGHIFAPVGRTDSRDHPYLTGLTQADLGGRDAFGPRAVRRALALLRLTARVSPGLGAASEIHIDRVKGLRLLPVQPAVPVEMGWGGFEPKLARLVEVLRLWAGRQGEIAGVSCVFADQVIVRTRPPSTAEKPRRGAARA
jgi:POTRA domain, FtsQ-type